MTSEQEKDILIKDIIVYSNFKKSKIIKLNNINEIITRLQKLETYQKY